MKLTLILSKILFLWILLLPARTGLAQPQEVRTGIYLINVYDLDINQHSYYVDCYIWFKWKGELDPMNIEFVNAVEKWGATVVPFYEEPQVLEDGYFYNGMRYEGRFYHAFDLERFPLDQHALDVQIENIDYSQDSLVYVAEENPTYVREDLVLPGWTILGTEVENRTHRYPINFGETGKPEAIFSNFVFELQLRRPFNYFLLKLLLPLLIVICVSLGALLINPVSIDARISLPIGGLLSAVFLQQSYSSALPDVGYMVLMDKIYLLVYALIAAILLRVVLMGNRVIIRKEALDIEQVRKSDRRRIVILTVLLIAGIGLLLL
ncbi:ligand-gated ion channel [Flavilitoribacter nigricans]|uniref:Neurotransmitter-gated ion-channel ligand-binding domain-containing protein n=1 Tax=Flavilitoribacter nigricans (strain ATCC 23147 / DSM 23189 / NBRC 102662 / NCIMB 1420 / SS-2) TaxID=1122177 RepID=A0A2D0NHG3_FLAN2|nr:hypothetical protein [Flavilitoribacter nigricans]PHN07917.1 hypothetical protein CRP01_03955 [Flavilitoribacter nigricans DSM 23189 = NBRC 102662]